MDIKDHIRGIADFPQSAILIYDISTLLAHAGAWSVAADASTTNTLVEPNAPALAAFPLAAQRKSASGHLEIGRGFL